MMEVGLSLCWLGWVTLYPNRKDVKLSQRAVAALGCRSNGFDGPKIILWTKMCLLTQSICHSEQQTPLRSVDQRASLCSQLLIVNEDWCLEGWPCLRFLSGMDAYWSLHFYALLGTQSPLFLMVFWSTLQTALVMIDGIDSDKNKPERMNMIEKERRWNSRNLDENSMKCFSIVSLVAYY